MKPKKYCKWCNNPIFIATSTFAKLDLCVNCHMAYLEGLRGEPEIIKVIFRNINKTEIEIWPIVLAYRGCKS